MRLDADTEEKLKTEVLKYIEDNRDNWNVQHTLAAVYWMKELLKHEEGNEKILVSAIYLHDIGYPDVLKGKKKDYKNTKSSKEAHMEIGAIEAEKILKKLDYSLEEIKEIVHLVRVHDKLDELSTPNEILVMEADSLSAIDRNRVKSNFSKQDYNKFIKFFERNRLNKIQTKTGKEIAKKLWPKAKN